MEEGKHEEEHFAPRIVKERRRLWAARVDGEAEEREARAANGVGHAAKPPGNAVGPHPRQSTRHRKTTSAAAVPMLVEFFGDRADATPPLFGTPLAQGWWCTLNTQDGALHLSFSNKSCYLLIINRKRERTHPVDPDQSIKPTQGRSGGWRAEFIVCNLPLITPPLHLRPATRRAP